MPSHTYMTLNSELNHYCTCNCTSLFLVHLEQVLILLRNKLNIVFIHISHPLYFLSSARSATFVLSSSFWTILDDTFGNFTLTNFATDKTSTKVNHWHMPTKFISFKSNCIKMAEIHWL